MIQMSKGFREKTISVTEHGFEVHENILEGITLDRRLP